MAGKIQGADLKTEAELIAAGADKTKLPLDAQIYVTANGVNKTLYQAIVDGDIGGGGSGGISFLSSADSTFVSSTGTGALFDDGAVAVPLDGSGGSPSAFSASRVTSFDSNGSLRFSRSAANAQGEGWAIPYSVQPEFRGQSCSFEGYYQTSANYVDGDIKVWLYDITNSALITPNPQSLLASLTPSRFKFEFQTSATGATYRLIFMVTVTTTTAWDVDVDNLRVGPTAYNFGSVTTDFKTVTGFVSSLTTNTTLTVIGRRDGDCFEGYAKMAFTGAPNAATNPVLTVPYTIDTSKMIDTSGGNTTVGWVAFSDTGVASYVGNVAYISTTTLEWQVQNASGTYSNLQGATSTVPFTIASGDKFIAYFRFPVVGWSSNVQLSDSYSLRRNSTRYSTSSAQSISNASSTIINFDSSSLDDLGSVVTGAAWKWTAKKTGTFKIKSQVTLASGGGWAAGEQANLSIFKNNATEFTRALHTQVATHSQIVITTVSDTIPLLAGETIDIRMFQNSGGAVTLNSNATDTFVTIDEVLGPSAIAASDELSFSYGSTVTVANTGADTKVILSTKNYDSHGNQYDTSTGLWTCKAPGRYAFFGSVFFTNITAAAAGRTVIGYFQFNGSGEWGIDRREVLTTTPGISHNVKPFFMFDCVVGSTVALFTFQNMGTNYSIQTGVGTTYMFGYRIGK